MSYEESFPDRFRRWYSVLPASLRVLMTANTVMYLVWVLAGLLGIGVVQGFVMNVLALSPYLPAVLYQPWQVLTYAFIHMQPGIWGLISFAFHMLWLYWLGREYEEFYGSHRLMGMYVMSALAGALLAIVAGTFMEPMNIPVAGTMAAVLGVICGVATINPDRGIALMLLGVIKMKWIAIAFLTISVLFAFGAWPYVATYLGGAAMGHLFARSQLAGIDLAAWLRPLFDRANRRDRHTRRRIPTPRFSRKSSTETEPSRWDAARGRIREHAPEQEATSGTDISEVNRLLDKINEKGYDSLTKEEKRTLLKASQND